MNYLKYECKGAVPFNVLLIKMGVPPNDLLQMSFSYTSPAARLQWFKGSLRTKPTPCIAQKDSCANEKTICYRLLQFIWCDNVESSINFQGMWLNGTYALTLALWL